jgi:hypothetical protein
MNHRGTACPPERVPGHQTQQQRLRRDPTGQPAETGDVAQRLHALLKLKMPYVLLHHIRHGHAQARGEILHRHPVLLFRVLKEVRQAIGESLRISRRIEFNGEFLALRHLPEVGNIGRDNGYTVSARQVRNTAATGGR